MEKSERGILEEIPRTMVEYMREIGEKRAVERRYFISSLDTNPELFLKTVRAHWGVGNSLHYVLDVALKEDSSRIRSGDAPENIAFIRRNRLNHSPLRQAV